MAPSHVVDRFRSHRLKKQKALHLSGIHFLTKTYVITKLPAHSRVLRLLARSILLALIFVTFPGLGPIIGGSTPADSDSQSGSNSINLELLPFVLSDLANEGHFKTSDKALLITNGDASAIYGSQILNDKEVNLISVTDLEKQSLISDESFDIAFSYGHHAATEFIDRTLKIGGIAVVQLSEDPSFAFNHPSNYKIVYLRRFDSVILAMRKTSYADNTYSAAHRKLLWYGNEAKKAALKRLEDVLLEPPRAASGKSNRYLKRTRYLPDLMGDSLGSYPRRVFIDVGLPEKEGGSGTGWFAKNYPTRNLVFEVYKIETVTEELSRKEIPQAPKIGMSDWLRKNVREEEYVVMKAEAEVVAEMVKSRAIKLVDELFLECKPQGNGVRWNGGRRAYWECLALYGRLRDEGVAVHQWWD